jgi:RHS repeat-associated protein
MGHLTRAFTNSFTTFPAAIPPSGSTVQYVTNTTYNSLNRPTNVSWTPSPAVTPPSASSVTFAHGYNKSNQRISQSVTDNSWFNYPAATPSTTTYVANELNQYTAVGSVTPGYDANGNLSSDGTQTFAYSPENRLIGAAGGLNYEYDAQGRRNRKLISGSGATTLFVNDADNREVLEYDGTTGAIQRWYAYGLGPNDVLSQMNVGANARATFIPDIQGSIIASTDSSSGAMSKLGYLPYGTSATAPTTFGYTGQRFDTDTGLYYYRARHYTPRWGRFLQPDPIGIQGGVNLYAYVGNDPLNLTDPSGFAADAINGAASDFYNQSILKPGRDIAGYAKDLISDPAYFLHAIDQAWPASE